MWLLASNFKLRMCLALVAHVIFQLANADLRAGFQMSQNTELSVQDYLGDSQVLTVGALEEF